MATARFHFKNVWNMAVHMPRGTWRTRSELRKLLSKMTQNLIKDSDVPSSTTNRWTRKTLRKCQDLEHRHLWSLDRRILEKERHKKGERRKKWSFCEVVKNNGEQWRNGLHEFDLILPKNSRAAPISTFQGSKKACILHPNTEMKFPSDPTLKPSRLRLSVSVWVYWTPFETTIWLSTIFQSMMTKRKTRKQNCISRREQRYLAQIWMLMPGVWAWFWFWFRTHIDKGVMLDWSVSPLVGNRWGWWWKELWLRTSLLAGQHSIRRWSKRETWF
jgi:hypothetical protein